MKRIQLIMLLFLLCTSALAAVDHFMLELVSGVTWLHNEAYGRDGAGDKDPDPIVYKAGLSFPLYFSETLFIKPSLTVIAKSWEYVSENNWAMPVDLMWQDLMVISLLLDIPFGYQLNFENFSVGFFIGPAFDFRIPVWGEEQSVRDDLADYFYSDFRIFNLSGGFFFVIPLSEKIAFTLNADSWVPVHNFWSNGGLPFSDGLMVTLSAGVRFTF